MDDTLGLGNLGISVLFQRYNPCGIATRAVVPHPPALKEAQLVDETQNNDAGEHQSTIEQAYRLKHDINKSITYGPGLNAREVVALKTLSAEEWAKVRRDYGEWIQGMQLFSNTLLGLAGIAGGLVFLWLVGRKGWVSWAAWSGGVLAFFAVAALFKREGHREGYLDGYDSGFEQGINKAYQIDDKEAVDILERATDMEMDERVIKAFDDKQNTQEG